MIPYPTLPRMQGCKATVCMPVTTPDIKVAAVRRLGGCVELVGDSYSETQTHAQARPYTASAVQRHRGVFIAVLHPIHAPEQVHEACVWGGAEALACESPALLL